MSKQEFYFGSWKLILRHPQAIVSGCSGTNVGSGVLLSCYHLFEFHFFFKGRISSLEFTNYHCQLPTADYRLPTTDHRLPTTSAAAEPITNYRSLITDHRLPTTDYQLPTTDHTIDLIIFKTFFIKTFHYE